MIKVSHFFIFAGNGTPMTSISYEVGVYAKVYVSHYITKSIKKLNNEKVKNLGHKIPLKTNRTHYLHSSELILFVHKEKNEVFVNVNH